MNDHELKMNLSILSTPNQRYSSIDIYELDYNRQKQLSIIGHNLPEKLHQQANKSYSTYT